MPNMKAMSRTMRIDLIPDVPAGRLDGDWRHPVVVSSGAAEGVRNPRLPSHEVDEHQSRYRELLQSIYDAALITDLDGVILESNARASEFLQWASDELEGKTVSSVISGADASLINTLCINLESERYTLIQAYCIRQDGTHFPSEIAVNRIRVGEGTLCFFVRDITIRRQAEEMLRTEHAAIQNAANGIVIADLNANLEYVNPAFASMLGYGHPDALSGVSVRNVVGDGESTDLMLEHVLEHGLTWTGEMQVVKPDGDVVDLEVLATCNRNSEGETVGIVFSFTDLSDRIRAEAALRETERQRVMLESLGAACHHLGQPATVLTANLEIIKSRLNSSDQLLCDLVDHSITATERLGQVLRKLNKVNEYRTRRYVGNNTDDNSESRILEI